MSSNHIYDPHFHSCGDRTPFTYLIGWSQHNLWYYGRRTAKYCHPSNLWVSYFTSSDYVKATIVQLGQPDVVQVRKVFNDISKCKSWEIKVLNRIKAVERSIFLNKSNATGIMDSTGLFPAKDSQSGEHLGLVSVSDPRVSSGEIVGFLKGTSNSIISNQKRGTLLVKDAVTGICLGNKPLDHPKVLSGAWVHIRTGIKHSKSSIEKNKESNSGFAMVKNQDGSTVRMRTDDPNFSSFKGVTAGCIWITEPISATNILLKSDRFLLDYLANGWRRGVSRKTKLCVEQ